jgi:hypothetical protein
MRSQDSFPVVPYREQSHQTFTASEMSILFKIDIGILYELIAPSASYLNSLTNPVDLKTLEEFIGFMII